MTPTKPEDALVEQIRALQKRATPGPWEAHGGYLHRQHWLIDAPGRRFIATIDGPPDEVGEADAHLIALVPQMADAITTLLERERRATKVLAELEQRATATLAAVDQYNEKNGTYIIGPSLLQLGKSIAKARAELTGDGVQPDQTS